MTQDQDRVREIRKKQAVRRTPGGGENKEREDVG